MLRLSPPSSQALPGRLAVSLACLLVGLGGCATAEPGDQGSATTSVPAVVTGTVASTPDQRPDPLVGAGECKVVTYTPSTATDAVQGELCRPKQDQRDVAVIVVHGGSGVGGAFTGMRPWAARYLAEGYVTFLPEYHLFRPGGNESPVFPRPEQNIKAAVQFVRGTANALGIRRDRIVVQGQSAGARIAAVAFTTGGDGWFGGPEIYPDIGDEVNGFIGFYHPYDGTMQYADQYFGGSDTSTDPRVRERLDRADSLMLADQARGPALFVTGGNDWSLITQQQDEFAARLIQNRHHAVTVVIKGGGHGFDEGGSRLSRLGEQAATETLRWLNDNFPQLPPRAAQNTDADLDSAPTNSGAPATTYPARIQSGSKKPGSGTSGSGGGSPTTVSPSSTSGPGAPTTPSPTVVVPSTSASPTSSAAAPTIATPTTVPAAGSGAGAGSGGRSLRR